MQAGLDEPLGSRGSLATRESLGTRGTLSSALGAFGLLGPWEHFIPAVTWDTWVTWITRHF